MLRNLKMGEGPYYILQRNYHLCALEIAKTVHRVFAGGGVLLDNSTRPTLSVLAIAKHPMARGYRIEQAIGGFDVRGEAARIDEHPDHVPIGVLKGAILRLSVEAGQVLRWDDVELAESRAVDIARAILAVSGGGRWAA
jgi:predicted homoserine dehydrogenase-like protein